MKTAARLDGIELSLIRQINALATPYSLNLGIGEPNVAPDARNTPSYATPLLIAAMPCSRIP